MPDGKTGNQTPIPGAVPAATPGGQQAAQPASSARPITTEDVRHVAKLARLDLPPERLTRLTGQLESILGYVAKISRVDVAGVEPMAHALPLCNVFRDDVVEPSLPLAQVLANAPETDGPFFKVPKVIGAEEDSAG
jgi:aspartyl-tRNA(Asn)/glutamyl-tRNA(Gln) amidotransferase subunit C